MNIEFKSYRLEEHDKNNTLILYLDLNLTEFSKEIMDRRPDEIKPLLSSIEGFISENLKGVKINTVKLMIGTLLVATIPLGASQVQASTIATGSTQVVQSSQIQHTVQSGESLWTISQKYSTSVDAIRTVNKLTSDTIIVGAVLIIPSKASTAPTITYSVVSGDSLFLIAKRYNTTVDQLKALNNLAGDNISVGQILKVPASSVSAPSPAPSPTPVTISYTVASGDSLWLIARRFGTSVDTIKQINNLTTDIISIGQTLRVPSTADQKPSVSYIDYKVASGDNAWSISIKFGIPMSELLEVNKLAQSSVLSIGQVLKIPVHHIPIKPTPGPMYGENLDWWTEAQYVVPIGKEMRVTDIATGRSFNIKRTIGANHADSEPLTATDSAIIKEVWGGSYSWTARAVIISVDGRKLAASMSSMPHSIQYITNNNFSGHFDLHFLNSTRHVDGLVDPLHQAQIRIAAGANIK